MIGEGTWDEFLVKMEKSLGLSCPITLEHAKVHLDSAIECAEDGDLAQVAYDAHTAGRILMVLTARIDKELEG